MSNTASNNSNNSNNNNNNSGSGSNIAYRQGGESVRSESPSDPHEPTFTTMADGHVPAFTTAGNGHVAPAFPIRDHFTAEQSHPDHRITVAAPDHMISGGGAKRERSTSPPSQSASPPASEWAPEAHNQQMSIAVPRAGDDAVSNAVLRKALFEARGLLEDLQMQYAAEVDRTASLTGIIRELREAHNLQKHQIVAITAQLAEAQNLHKHQVINHPRVHHAAATIQTRFLGAH
jgi:hypothetical protein